MQEFSPNCVQSSSGKLVFVVADIVFPSVLPHRERVTKDIHNDLGDVYNVMGIMHLYQTVHLNSSIHLGTNISAFHSHAP